MIKVFFLVYLQFFNPIDAAAAYGDHRFNPNPGNAMFQIYTDHIGPYKTLKDCEDDAKNNRDKTNKFEAFCVETNVHPARR